MCHQRLFVMRSVKMSLDSPSPGWPYRSMEQPSRLDQNQCSLVDYFALPHQLIWFPPVEFMHGHLHIMVIAHWKEGPRYYFSIECGRTQLPWFYTSAQYFHRWDRSSIRRFWGFCYLPGPWVLIAHCSTCPLKDFLRTIHSHPLIYVKQHNSYKWKCHY